MGDQDTLSDDDMPSEDGFEELPKIVYKEMLLMTDEERAARTALRLAMSACCMDEAWSTYRRLTFAGYTSAPGDPDFRPGSVLYDPEFDRRRYYLGRKYRSILDGYYRLKEAPSLPYIRPGFPRLLDVPGRHTWAPPPCRQQMPEHDPDYSLPESVSGKCTMVRVYNMMFMEDEERAERSTQTWRRDFNELSKKWTKCRDWVDCRPDVKMEHFDLEDIPLDAKGYPIGKSVGICEWCKQDVLPLPTQYRLRHTWDKTRLYCCARYREFVQAAQNMERKLVAEHELKNQKIDIRPNKNKKYTRKSLEGAGAGSGVELTPEERRAIMTAKVKAIKERDAAERQQKILRKEQDRLNYLAGLKDKNIDTYDLPWDPYESKFKHNRIFNDQVFDESAFHYYGHADVVMSQSGLFDETNTTISSATSSKINKESRDKRKSTLHSQSSSKK